MLMSKLYNKAKSVTASDPRVITPSSIPIFILPPTLDKIPTHKTELEDTFDCWSIIGEEIPEVCTTKTTTPSENRLNKSNPNLVNQKVEENTDFLQKKFFNQLKSSPLNLIQKSAVPCSSLENLKKITRQNTKASHGGQESDTIHRKSFESKSQNSTKSLVIKNLFRSGFLNTNTLNDEIKTKENFCNLWVLHGDYKSPCETDSPTSNSYVKKSDSQILKSASVNNLNLINKNEEQLQREYLTNLLNQLKTEEKLSRDSSKKTKYKRDKRSKSETLLTLNSLLYGDETKYDLANALNRKSSRKRSSNLSSKCLMSSPAKNNGYGYFLDVKRNNSTDILPRRFSFRNLFKFKTSQKKLSSASINEVQDKNIFNLEIPHKSKRNSNQSLSNSSLITDSSKLNTPLANATGSVLKFHSFKLKNIENLETNNNNNSKALSEPIVNRINLKTNNLTVEKNSSVKSNKSFQDDENDFDKIFNDYLSKNDSKRKDLLKETEYKKIIPTSPSISTKSYKNIFKFIFRTKSNCHNLGNGFNECSDDDVSKHRRSRTLDAETKNKLKFFKSKNSVLINESFKREDSNGDFENESNHDRDSLKSLNQPDLYNHFSLNNFDLFQLEKEKKSKKNRRKSSLVKSNETLYIDAGLMRNKHSYSNGKKEEKTIKGFISKEKLILKSFIDVSFEKLQQSMHGHLISINIRNFRVEPLIEINFIKAKLSYLTFELVEPDQIKENSNHTILNGLKKKKLLAKIHKIKVKKCKFDNNLKNFSKPIDFDLVNEHFMDVSAEAMNLQMKKIFTKSNNHLNGSLDAGDVIENGSKEERKFTKFSTFESDIDNDASNEKLRKKFVFYLSIEIHSYIPVSRKILSSTFRKKKRIFKGQCQIHENFINSTQFTKNFILNEV